VIVNTDNLYWACRAVDYRHAEIYVVAGDITTLVKRTPIRMAARIVRTHNLALAQRDGIDPAQFPEITADVMESARRGG
jgi:hypothetical protein